MTALLTEVSKSLPAAYVYYIIRIIMYTAVAALGIYLGIRLRKKKNAEENEKDK